MLNLETRSEVKATVTRDWYVTFHHPKMHDAPNLGFISQIIQENATDMIILQSRSRSQNPANVV